ncbi:cutinase-domain-containing protein [Xylariales sp. AK1849]|nr:cutinase-domain-containing protein [Xylariales sp. AK1849]
MLLFSSSASSWLLLLLISGAYGVPTPKSGTDVNPHGVNTLIHTGLSTLVSLITALKSGQINENGLWGVVNINDIRTNGTGGSNWLSNVMVNKSDCPDVAVLFARGTSEPGNMGFLTGPPLTTALQHYANTSRVAVQGVDYPAIVAGFQAGGSPIGASVMAALTNATKEACPATKLVLSGYSQGAQVVRKAAALLGNVTASQLNSVVLFGDPGNGTQVPGVAAERTFTACHAGDRICEGGSVVLPQHLNYSGDAPAAAMFIMQKTGLGMGSADAVLEGMGDIPMMNETDKSGLGDTVISDLGSDDADDADKGLQGILGLG